MSNQEGMNSPVINRILIAAQKSAAQMRSRQIQAVHVLLPLLESKDSQVSEVLKDRKKSMESKIRAYAKKLPQICGSAAPELATDDIQTVFADAYDLATRESTEIDEIHILYGTLKNQNVKAALADTDTAEILRSIENREKRKSSKIEEFATELVEQARKGVLDPVIGRDKEIRATIEILTKKIKSNVMLLGEPGVGKTAIANGLAQLIASGKAPGLSNCKIYSVDIGAIVAGTMYHGQFEERLKALIKEAEDSKRESILFIDEIHTVLGAGKTQGAMNAANMLKPGLASGAIRCIGATTFGEYKEYVEKDPAFGRRFVTLAVSEPSVEDTFTILRGLRERFESYHGISILNETLECAAEMGFRYMTGGHMPDTAITLLDAACAAVKISLESEPAEIMSLKSRIWAAELEKTAIISDKERDTGADNQERLQQVEEKIRCLREALEPMQKEYGERMECIVRRRKLRTKLEQMNIKLANAERERNLSLAIDIKNFAIPEIEQELAALGKEDQKICIRPEHIAEAVSNITGIPVRRLTMSENERLLQMEERLNEKVVGQEEAIRAITDSLIRSKAGLSRSNRPIGSFLFLGPTGVGKTQLAKSLAYEILDDEGAIVRLDMSEYMEQHSVSRLIGSPPGYIGYETGGYLTEKVRNKPYTIILIDEIEKAHKRVSNIFLQVLDEGRLTDSHGRTVDFTNTIIIMTSNLGCREILKEGAGTEAVLEAAKAFFPPEFINRLDSIQVFSPLRYGDLVKIVGIYIEEINRRAAKEHVRVSLDDSATATVIENAYTPEYGARPLQRYIENTITTDLAKIFLGGGSPPKGQNLDLTVCGIGNPLPQAVPVYQSPNFLYYANI